MGLGQPNNYFPDIGARVVQEMKNKGLEGKYLASFLKDKYGRTQDSTEAYITLIRGGYVLGTKKGVYATPKNLEKLSIFLYALGIDKEDSLVHDLMSIYQDFLYPPTGGIHFDKIKPKTHDAWQSSKGAYMPIHGEVNHTIFTNDGHCITKTHGYRRTPDLDNKATFANKGSNRNSSVFDRFISLENFILENYGYGE